MSSQNPTIPTPTDPKGIDLVVSDLQTLLDFNLSWLTNGMGRAYRLTKVRANQTTVFLPQVYLGVANRYDYFAATPDNDKQGQNVFFVGDATLPNQQKGFYGWVEHEVGIIFSANLETIDSVLLATEDFTEHLIQDVRDVLIRLTVGKGYRVNIDSITREFDDVYAEFDVSRDRGVAHAPMTHFRFNCTITFKEDCTGISLNRCAAILQNLTQDDLLNCILPTYDFSQTATQNALTGQQQSDLTDWLCSAFDVKYSLLFDGVDEGVVTNNYPVYDIENTVPLSGVIWIKTNSSGAIQFLVNKYDFGAFRGWFLAIQADLTVRFSIQNNANINGFNVATTTAISINTWTCIGFDYKGDKDGNNVDLYFNGVAQPTTVTYNTLTLTSKTTQLLKWGIRSSGGAAFSGYMNDCRLWTTSIGSANFLTEYNSGTPLDTPVLSGSLLAWNKFGDGGVYSGVNWVLEDFANVGDAFFSDNMEKADRVTDIP